MLNLNILIFFFFNKCLLLLLLLLSVAVLSCFRPATGAQLPAYECKQEASACLYTYSIDTVSLWNQYVCMYVCILILIRACTCPLELLYGYKESFWRRNVFLVYICFYDCHEGKGGIFV